MHVQAQVGISIRNRRREQKKNIVLFNPSPYPKTGRVRMFSNLPLGLLCASALLDAEGYRVHIISEDGNPNYLDEILYYAKDAVLLGVSSMTGPQIRGGLEASKAVKEAYPQIRTVWGGVHPSILPKETCQNPYVDIVVKGYGEMTLWELVHRLEADEPLEQCLGICFKQDGQIIETPDRPMFDFDKIPPIPFHLVDMEEYIEQTKSGERMINYITSYGCPLDCTFCSEPLTSQRRWKGKSPQRVVDEVERLWREYKIDCLKICDDNFFVDKRRVAAICQELIDRKIQIKWGRVPGRCDTLGRYPDELWQLMRRSGFYHVYFGLDSGSDVALRKMKGRQTNEDAFKLIDRCKEHGVRLSASVITGMPFTQEKDGVTYEDEFVQTVDMIRACLDRYRKFPIHLYTYTPYPGSEKFKESLEWGLTVPDRLEGWIEFYHRKTLVPWLTKNQKNFDKYFVLLRDIYSGQKLNHKNPLKAAVYRLIYWSTVWRWKHRFFRFPVEYMLLRAAGKLKKKPPVLKSRPHRTTVPELQNV
ncbi:MAG: radical SAM protein [Acidobacteriota bacterium]|nr:B12-binding domain-containing radical SAM protein [Blastocatellia bacterium]MDW8239716.1 radical SAM protein [Acidobacteriota bacterium]